MIINFPIKGEGLTIQSEIPTPDGVAPCIIHNRYRVVELHFLENTPNKDSIALEIAYLLQEAACIGYDQGLASVRHALGLEK